MPAINPWPAADSIFHTIEVHASLARLQQENARPGAPSPSTVPKLSVLREPLSDNGHPEIYGGISIGEQWMVRFVDTSLLQVYHHFV